MLLRIIRVACAICLAASLCLVPVVASAQSQTTAPGKSAKKSAKKTGKRTVKGTSSQPVPAAGASDRSVIPALHDARHGY
jgi:hypothetical protein